MCEQADNKFMRRSLRTMKEILDDTTTQEINLNQTSSQVHYRAHNSPPTWDK